MIRYFQMEQNFNDGSPHKNIMVKNKLLVSLSFFNIFYYFFILTLLLFGQTFFITHDVLCSLVHHASYAYSLAGRSESRESQKVGDPYVRVPKNPHPPRL